MGVTIHLGHGHTCPVDLDELLCTNTMITSITGGGKGRLLRRVLEETHPHVPHHVIDPEGEARTLREKFDYVLVSAGDDGDVKASPKTAGALARKLVEHRAHAIFDLSDFKVPERVEYVREHLQALMSVPRSMWAPLLVSLDEMQLFAPQDGGKEDSSRAEVVDLLTRGLKRGYAVFGLTQRLAKVDKNAVGACANQILGMTTSQVDIDRSSADGAWPLPVAKRLRDQLPQMSPGQFFASGPAFRQLLPDCRFDAGEVQTTHPKRGSRLQASPPVPPSAQVKSLLAKLAIVEEDPKETSQGEGGRPWEQKAALIAEVAKLQDQLRDRPTVEKLVSVLKPEDLDFIELQLTTLEGATRSQGLALDHLRARVVGLRAGLNEFADMVAMPARSVPRHRPQLRSVRPTPSKAPTKLTKRGKQGKDEPLPQGERKVLMVLVQADRGVPRTYISAMTGQATSYRDSNLKRLRARGLVEQCGDGGREVRATPEGYTAAGDFPPLPTGRELLGWWLRELPQGEATVLEFIADHTGEVSREDISDETGQATSYRDSNIKRLRAKQLITTPRQGVVALAQELRG
jgi:hypothetical protein